MLKMFKDIHLRCFFIIITLTVTAGVPATHCNGGEDILQKCPLKFPELSSPEISTREELDKSCVKLQQGIKCIEIYINVCMEKNEQLVFRHIYAGMFELVQELCTRGSYQDEYLKHADCVRTISSEYETCETNYEKALTTINTQQQGDQTDYLTSLENSIKTVCCSFQEYLICSEETVQRSCGDEAALFTTAFLKRMSSNIIKEYCFEYNRQECGLTNKGSHNISHSVLLLISVASLINLAFYASDNSVPTSPGSVFNDGSEVAFDQFNSNCTAAVINGGTNATVFGQQKPASNFWSEDNADTVGGFESTDVDQQLTTQASTIFGNASGGSFSSLSPAGQALGSSQGNNASS